MAEQLLLDRPELQATTFTVELGGNTYKSDLPGDALPFEVNPNGRELLLKPEALDNLRAGPYHMTPVIEEEADREFAPYVPAKKLDVKKTDQGRVVNVEAFADKDWYLGEGMDLLMSGLGFDIERDQIVGVPTPETIEKAAAELGVKIKRMPAIGEIKAEPYLEAFEEGAYPVATGTENDYKHDIEDDHITALVLGAEPLKESLRSVAKKARTGDEQTKKDVTAGVDVFTATLRAVISPHRDLAGEAYGQTEGRRTLLEAGQRIGISADMTETILRTAQENAHKLGIPVTELQ